MNFSYYQQRSRRVTPARLQIAYYFGRKPGFYPTFISVVFGFLAYISIQWMAERTLDVQIMWHEWALFAGVMFLIVHFWLVCLASEDIEKPIYILAESGTPSRVFNSLYLTNVPLSLALACPIAVMSRNCFAGKLVFWKGYVTLAVLSLAYDLVAICFSVLALVKDKAYSQKANVKRFAALYGSWLIQDVVFLGAALLLYNIRKLDRANPEILAFVFCGFCLLGLAIDVVLLHPDLYLKREGKESE
jgi:hypothetical protein